MREILFLVRPPVRLVARKHAVSVAQGPRTVPKEAYFGGGNVFVVSANFEAAQSATLTSVIVR